MNGESLGFAALDRQPIPTRITLDRNESDFAGIPEVPQSTRGRLNDPTAAEHNHRDRDAHERRTNAEPEPTSADPYDQPEDAGKHEEHPKTLPAAQAESWDAPREIGRAHV